MALKIDIPEKYKPEFPFLDDAKAMEKLSYESFTKAVDDHIKKLYRDGGIESILAFRNTYQKRLDFVRSELEYHTNNRELKSCDLCYSYCVKRGFYYIENSDLLRVDRLSQKCLDKIKALTIEHSAWGIQQTFEMAYKCDDCQYEIVDGDKKDIGSYRTLMRRVENFYPNLYKKTMAEK